MLSRDTLKIIAQVFCRDSEEFYSYKSGPQLIDFFNEFLGNADVYHNGFPTRYIYACDNLIEIMNRNELSKFFSKILGKGYLMKDSKCNELDAIRRSQEIHAFFGNLVKADDCLLLKKGTQFTLVKESDDLDLISDQGGFAKVYLQKSSGKILKKLRDKWMIDDGIRSRFKREYTITKSLGDIPGIINVSDFDEDGSSYTMEKADTNLENYVQTYNIDETTKTAYIRNILSVMAIVHDRNIIHRDISPNNIFLKSGIIKVADFGLGKNLQLFHSHKTMHTAYGQYLYVAPEQLSGLIQSDKRSDVYSLGRLINFIMTKNPSDSTHSFKGIAEKATNHDPDSRHRDAGELLAALDRIMKLQQQKAVQQELSDKMQNGIFDDEVETFIYMQDEMKIGSDIVGNDRKLTSVYYAFIRMSEKHAKFIMSNLNNYLGNFLSWNDYDPISSFAAGVFTDEFSFAVQEIAAQILSQIAYGVNRYHAQGLIESIIEDGVDPHIEDALRRYKE